jgi:phosphoribosylamine--glycine ligase
MRVLLVGGGGREHALAWKLRQSQHCDALYAAPGNAGIAQLAECVPVAASAIADLVQFARQNAIDLVVVGPESPLIAGLADALQEAGIPCFGPTRAAAQLEGSKAFAKQLMAQVGAPTAPFAVFDDADQAHAPTCASGSYSDPAWSRQMARRWARVCSCATRWATRWTPSSS